MSRDGAHATQRPARDCSIVFHPTSVEHPDFVRRQIKWWTLVTGVIVLITVAPGVYLASKVQHWIEIGDSLIITFGVRTLALLSKLIIHKLFAFINEGALPYAVCGGNFFTHDNPLNQYLWERRARHAARSRNVRDRAHQMGAHGRAWLALIVLSYVVRLAPDLFGASLVAQHVPRRIVQRMQRVTAPDLGFGDGAGLQFRGNCVWARVGADGSPVARGGERRDAAQRFGFIIWQYCVDLLREGEQQRVDTEFRTLRGKDRDGKAVQGVFHIEVITETVFSEDWEPFSNRSRAQRVFWSVLRSDNKCANEFCTRYYRTADMRIIYALLRHVGMHQRALSGDDDSLEALRNSTGRVVALLQPTTRTAFLVLIATVNVILLVQSASHTEEEVGHVALSRAVAELKKVPGANHFTAIALPRINMARRWAKRERVACFIAGKHSASSEELVRRCPQAEAVRDEQGAPLSFSKRGITYVKALVHCDVFQWGASTPKAASSAWSASASSADSCASRDALDEPCGRRAAHDRAQPTALAPARASDATL